MAGVAGALWQFVPLRVPDGAIYWLFTLLGAALLLWPPLTHLVGGVLMLRRGSAGAAVVTAFLYLRSGSPGTEVIAAPTEGGAVLGLGGRW